jgi:hypothetical protein
MARSGAPSAVLLKKSGASRTGGLKQGQYMDLNHFLRHFQRRRRQRRQPAIARPTAICAPSPPGGPASGAHRSEGGGRSDGRRSTCPRALGRGGLWRARERWRRWPRPAGRTPRSACRAPPPFGPVGPRQKYLGGSFRVYQFLIEEKVADLLFFSPPRENGGGCTPSA